MANHRILDEFDGNAVGENFLASLHNKVHGATDFSQLSRWLEQNTKHPLKPKENWTFAEHEYQIDILNDTAHEAFFQKCSQVGASELFVRMKLAMLGISEALTIIYVLPTRSFAMRFAKGRVDPVILNSPALQAMKNKDVDSNEMKQFGNCFLYISGSYGQSAAISVPAQVLFWDEVDFCNQKNLTTFRSRMGHAKEDDLWFVRGFSTPTVFDYGINSYFKRGSQAYYGVFCGHCRDFVQVDFFRDLVIPGFDRDVKEWDKEHLSDPDVNVDACFFRCQHCNHELPWKHFLDPEKRHWLHTFEDRAIRSRQISPFDVPAINPPWRTLRQVDEYEVKGDWVNFKVGVPYEDASSSFLVDTANWSAGTELEPPLSHRELNQLVMEKGIETDTQFFEWLFTQQQISSSCSLGMDVGKTSWFVIRHVSGNERPVIHAERAQASNGNLKFRYLYLFYIYGCLMGVGDAGPDFTLSQSIVRALPGRAWACYYAASKDNQLQRIQLKAEEGTVSVLRTRTLDMLVSKFNNGQIPMAKLREEPTMRAHLKSVKRVTEVFDEGEKGSKEKARWISTDDDHFCHALLYSEVAADLVYSLDGIDAHERGRQSAIGILPSVGKFRPRG